MSEQPPPASEVQVREQVARIIADAFRGPSQMTRFLEHTVDRALAGDTGSLKETLLGMEVLGKGPAFDPRQDPSVRVLAHRLRTKLDGYYGGPGKADPVRIEYDPGSYTPTFRLQVPPAAPPPTAPPPEPAASHRATRRLAVTAAAVAAAAILIGSRTARDASTVKPVPELRFDLAADADRPYDSLSRGGRVAISPDGTMVAFATRALDASRGDLRIHSLKNSKSQVLETAGAGRQPFWSPDGKHLGFIAGSKLRVMAIADGHVRTLCGNVDVYHPSGASWNSKGAILFGADSDPGLSIASVATGDCRKITFPAPNASHMWPHFLPDSEHFLYTVTSANPDQAGINVASLSSPSEGRRLVRGVHAAQYAEGPDGRPGVLLYVERGALYAVRFDPQALAVSGEPWVVEKSIGHYSFNGLSDFTLSANGILAFRTGEGVPNRELIWVGRDGRRLGSLGTGIFRYPSLSADGRRLLVERIDVPSEQSDIWLMEEGQPPQRRTLEPAMETGPVWSPDGRRFVYGDNNLWLRGADPGASPQLLLPGPAVMATSWFADGRRIVFLRRTAGKPRELCIAALADPASHRCLTTPGEPFDAQVSPDGNWIAYRAPHAGSFRILVQSTDPDGESRLVQVSADGKSSGGPRWSRNGRELYFVQEAKMMAVPVTTSRDRIQLGTPVKLFDAPFFFQAYGYAMSSDGQRFLFSAPVGGSSEPRPGRMSIVLNRFGDWRSVK